MLSGLDYMLLGLAGLAAGVVNALAGGGTLISFPMLTAVGLPAVAANVTNTVALCPGIMGGIFAQRRDLEGQGRRLWLAVPIGILGGIAGGLLLLRTDEQAFRSVIPYLILLASGLLAAQDWIRSWLVRHPHHATRPASAAQVTLPVGLAAIYGGYFGAGLGVILLAVLGLTLDDTLARLNALKQAVALAVNLAAAVLFLFSGHMVWSAAVITGAGALIGGSLGGRLFGVIRPATLRAAIVIVGVVVAIVYLVR